MATLTDQALVLRQWDFSESSQTVLLFGRETGLLRGLAKGAHRDRAPFSGGFDLLTRGEVVAIPKGSTELAALIEWDLQEVFWGPRQRWRAYQAGLYIVDALRAMLIDADPHPALFDQAVTSLRALETDERLICVVEFQWTLLVEAGYTPRLALSNEQDEARAALGFDPVQGVLTPDPGPGAAGGPWRVRRETVQLLRAVERREPISAASTMVIARAGKLLGEYIAVVSGRHFEGLRDLFEGLVAGAATVRYGRENTS